MESLTKTAAAGTKYAKEIESMHAYCTVYNMQCSMYVICLQFKSTSRQPDEGLKWKAMSVERSRFEVYPKKHITYW